MTKKLTKECRKMLIKVMTVFLIISIAVSVIYIYITYSAEIEIIKNTCHSNFNNMYSNSYYLTSSDENGLSWKLSIDMTDFGINNTRKPNSECIVFNTTKTDIVAQTRNVDAVEFCGNEYNAKTDELITKDDRTLIDGTVDYDEFRNSMTDEQYDEIVSYLKEFDRDSDSEYYELLCTEFYCIDKANAIKQIIPKTLQIVLTKSSHDWYVQDEVIATYKLNVQSNICDTVYKIGDIYRNALDNDFVFGRYEDQNLKRQLIDAMDIEWVEYPYNEEPVFYEVEPFTYIYYECNSNYYQYDVNDKGIYDEYINCQYVSFQYFEKVNVLESCINRIGLIFIYTLLMFIIVGLAVWLMSWLTLKKQIEIEQRRRNMTNSMAHDLKTPLFIISGNAENLIECTVTEEEKYYARNIVNKVNSVNELVHSMLNLSALEAENFRLSAEQFNMSELVNDVVNSYTNVLELCDIHFEFQNDIQITADKKLIECAVHNLVDNALKYTNDRGSIVLKLDEHSFFIENSVGKDTKLNLRHIWEPYRRLENCKDRDGNGLGLSIVKSVFEIHKFRYGVKFKNSVITFWFKF